MVINIRTNNAAFQDGNKAHELVRLLRELADKVERLDRAPLPRGHNRPAEVWNLYDVNGNLVGTVR